MTPLKSDSPGHFSTLKSDKIKFLTTGREKVTPPMKFWLPGGSFFNDFSTLKISLYTHANEVVKVYWFHHSCLSVCPSVCPSVKKWFLYNNSSSVWHTMMIPHIYVDFDPRRTSVDFGSKGQRWNLDFFTVSAPQLHLLLAYNNDTSQMYWPRPEKDLYWFWGQRIKGQGHIWSLNFVSFPHDIHLFFGIQ